MPTTLPLRHRYPREDDLNYSPPSSGLSSDDEDAEYVRAVASRVRPMHRRRTSEKIDGERNPMMSGTDRDYAAKRYNSTARESHFLSGTRDRTSPSIPRESGEVFVTTMDEDDQQLFIALFYWRRKVIETHFSAWKWVVFTLRQSAKQIHRQGLHARPKKPISAWYAHIEQHPPRRNLILQRHTGRSSAEESENNQSVAGNTVPITKGKRDDIDPQGLKGDSSSLPIQETAVASHSTEKRRQFRAELRLVYSRFGLWKSNTDESRKHRVQQLALATNFYRAKQLKTALRAWKSGSRILKLKRKRMDGADQFHCVCVKRFAFLEWKRYYRVEREITRRLNVQAAQRKRLAFQHWNQCILQTRKCRIFAAKRCHNNLHLVWRSLQQGVAHAEQDRLESTSVTSHYQNKLKNSVLRLWREAVFEDPSYLQSFNHGARISLATGVRKWRRFMTERQMSARKVLLADFFRYRVCLRRAIRGWGQFLEWKRQRKQVYDGVRRHYERNLKMCSVRRLCAAVHVNRTSRSQVRMATRWHQRKLATRSFELWVTSARNHARLSTFRRAVQARTLINVLQAWTKQTAVIKNLRSKQCIVSNRWNGLLLTRCMARWERTLHINSFITSLELKRQNVSIARHFRAWQSWSKTKMSWRNIVEQQRFRNEEDLLQRVAGQWFGITLRKRCINRIVKLFRKKQSRSRVKWIFQLWRVHVHLSIAKRKRDLDRARLSLVRWKKVCRDRKEKRITMAVATQYYSECRYAIAIRLWASFANRSARSRRTEANALSHYFRQLLRRSLQHWYIAARGLRRQAEFLSYRQHIRDQKAMTRYLHAWYTVVRQRTRLRTQKWAALQFQMENLLRRSFFVWIQFLEARRASDEKVCFAMATYENSLRCKILLAWCLSTRKSIQLRRKCALMRSARKQRHLQSSVAQWSNFVFERQRHRNQIAMAENFYNQYLLCLTMYHWQDKWSQTAMLRHKQAKAITKINARRLEIAVSQWHAQYQNSSNIRAKYTKAYRFYTKKSLAKHFGLWKCNQEAVRHKVSKRRFVTRLRQQKSLSRMFQRWQHFSEIRALESLQNKQAICHRATCVLGLAFRYWKRYRSKRTLHKIAYSYRKRLLLRKCWFGWKLYRKNVAKVRQYVLVTSQLLRSNLVRATFVQWKLYTSRHQTCRYQLYRAEDHQVHWQCKQSVARLRKHARFQQTVVKAAALGHINGTRHVWRLWRRFVASKRDRKSRCMLAERTHRQKRQRRHFSAWKALTKRCMQGRRDKSDALYRVSCLRMVWTRWLRAVRWRRCIVTMEYRRLEYLQTTILRRWRAHIRAQIKQKTMATRAIVFQKTQLRAKAWRSWLRYITNCHEKKKQLVWVLSYYSVEVLLRRSLVSWKEMVKIKQVRREHDELATSFNTHRLIREGYRKWRAYVELRKMKLERVEAQLHKAELIALSRNVRKWRSRSAVWRQQHQSERLATRFYIRKRLMNGLNKLLSWRDSQKTIRSLTMQAKHVRDSKAVVACFRHWQRYHQWRRRYALLTRVFKQNQKGDAFTRWKSYWKKRRSINEKRLQARVFHCVHVEQSVLALWRTFVRGQKQMKIARSFNTAKVLSTTFRFWTRRVHVLRQMRKMFLYQESFRAQTHFNAWRRFVVARKQLNERIRRAMKFKDGLRKLDVWQKWCAWVLIQRQERATIELAVGFRKRFFARKSFAMWKVRAAKWKRQRVLRDQALLQCQASLLRQGFLLLADWRQSNLRLAQLERKLSAQSVERRKRLVISNLRALCTESDRKRDLIVRACQHWQLSHQQKYWGRIMLWFDIARYRKLQQLQADAFARTQLLRRCIDSLQIHICRMKQVKKKVEVFQRRYFCCVTDDCFYQWRSFTTFKQKLRVLRRKTLQLQRRQRLQQWHRVTVEQVRRRAGMQQITIDRRRRELLTWFNHWESVCTDQWIEKELIAHHQRHARKQRALRSAVKTLKSQLPARLERQKCKTFFLQHHQEFLIQVLQRWRQATTTSTCDV